jgi:hypothetical protein
MPIFYYKEQKLSYVNYGIAPIRFKKPKLQLESTTYDKRVKIVEQIKYVEITKKIKRTSEKKTCLFF